MNAGDTFFYKGGSDREHLWIVVSNPDAEQVLIVNFTSFRGGGVYHDPACIVEKDEHPYLMHRSWIRYEDAMLVPAKGLREIFRRSLLRRHEPVSEALLARIRRGAVESENVPLKCRQAILDQGLVDEDDY